MADGEPDPENRWTLNWTRGYRGDLMGVKERTFKGRQWGHYIRLSSISCISWVTQGRFRAAHTRNPPKTPTLRVRYVQYHVREAPPLVDATY